MTHASRIWHGLHARLHQGTIVVLSDLHEHDECCGESAAIERFDGARGQWLVRLRSGALAGRERFVPEASMQLSHCRLAPEAKLRSRLGTVPAQGAGCGRGLVAAEPCAPGQTLFEEAPFLLAPHNATHMWSARWRLHLETALAARRRRRRGGRRVRARAGPARDDALRRNTRGRRRRRRRGAATRRPPHRPAGAAAPMRPSRASSRCLPVGRAINFYTSTAWATPPRSSCSRRGSTMRARRVSCSSRSGSPRNRPARARKATGWSSHARRARSRQESRCVSTTGRQSSLIGLSRGGRRICSRSTGSCVAARDVLRRALARSPNVRPRPIP